MTGYMTGSPRSAYNQMIFPNFAAEQYYEPDNP